MHYLTPPIKKIYLTQRNTPPKKYGRIFVVLQTPKCTTTLYKTDTIRPEAVTVSSSALPCPAGELVSSGSWSWPADRDPPRDDYSCTHSQVGISLQGIE